MSEDQESEKPSFVGRKVLVIDDSETVRTQVKHMLEPHGIEAVLAVNGEEGIEKIQTIEDIALVFCDVNMPKLDGISMLRKIKSEDIKLGGKNPIPPVVMLTTESSKAVSTSAKEVGAKGWIIKPLKQDVLDSILSSFVK